MDVRAELAQRGLSLPGEAAAAFDWGRVDAFTDFLIEHNERGGFFSAGDAARILERHVFESLVFVHETLEAWQRQTGRRVSRETRVLDAGSGPGLPGYLFACLADPPELALLDSSRRRLGILEEALPELQPDPERRPACLYGRAEEIDGDFDIVTARALIPYPPVAELLTNLVRTKGMLALFLAEVEASPRVNAYLGQLGLVSRETIRPAQLSAFGARSILILLKARPASKGYPRSWKRIKDALEQWKK